MIKKTTFIVAGLGNPGEKYKNTRHNVGYEVMDTLFDMYSLKHYSKKHSALIGKMKTDDKKIILVKPLTYMNNSGHAISKIIRYYKGSLDNLIIVYDDIDLKEGVIRVRRNGSAGTHNGMRSVIKSLKTQDFPRVRIGIGRPDEDISLVDYVLSPFKKNSIEKINKSVKSASEAIDCFIFDSIDKSIRTYNGTVE